MALCKDMALSKSNTDGDLATKYSKRLNYAASANKAQKSTIEKLKIDLENQFQLNKNLTTKLDRVVQLCNTRQILIRNLKDDLNRVRNEKSEIIDEKRALQDEIQELRYTSRMKLSATQEDVIQLTRKNQEDQEELRSQILSMKVQINSLKRELKSRETQISEFVKKTKNSVCIEMNKLSRTVEEGTARLQIAEEKSKELCKGIIKLLTMFYQRRMARRLLEERVGSPRELQKLEQAEQKRDKNKKKQQSEVNKKPETSLSSIMSSTQESIRSIKNELNKVSPAASATLKDVIGQFHILIHKPNFSDELGTFLFKNIVNPFLNNSE